MSGIIEFLKTNTVAAFWIMAAIVFILTQLIKLPIKAATSKLNESTRKKVNSLILLLPFVFGIGIEYLYCAYIAGTPFDVVEGVILGGQSIAFYGIVERFFNVKVDNPYTTTEGQAVIESVKDSVSDGTLTSTEVAEVIQSATGTTSQEVASTTEDAELQNFLDAINK